MKATVSRKELAESLAIAGAASSNRSNMPVLTSIRIEAAESCLTLTGCDGEMWAASTLTARVEVPGAVCVAAKLLTEIVVSLPAGDVDLTLEGAVVILRQGASEWRLTTHDAEDFPEIPPVVPQSDVSLTMGEFRDAVASVDFAVSEDGTRAILTGVLLAYDGTTVTLVATDTHRLAVRRLQRPGVGSDVHAIISEKTLRSIRSLPVDDNQTITLQLDQARVKVEAGGSLVVAQMIQGNFPNWERVIPAELTRSWMVDREELLGHVKRLDILARDSAYRLRFTYTGENIVISTRSEERGEAKEEMPCIAKNGEVQIAFNGRYVRDAVSAMKCESVTIEMIEPSRPAIFRPTNGGEDHFCVIMPMAV